MANILCSFFILFPEMMRCMQRIRLSFNAYLDILAPGATLVLEASFWHKPQVSGLAHKAHFRHISAKGLEIAETVAQYVQDNQDQSRVAKLFYVRSSCSSN
jgi:hypothetical protein